jgi:hypothetical protein
MERERERKREIYRERDRERVREKERERERERESERERERERLDTTCQVQQEMGTKTVIRSTEVPNWPPYQLELACLLSSQQHAHKIIGCDVYEMWAKKELAALGGRSIE